MHSTTNTEIEMSTPSQLRQWYFTLSVAPSRSRWM